MEGSLIAIMVMRELPSKNIEEQLEETIREDAKRAAWPSPRLRLCHFFFFFFGEFRIVSLVCE